jgi:hypothetical protein
LVTPKRQERPAEVNPNRHQMEQHERDQEKANVFIFGRERSANKTKINNAPNQCKREQWIKNAFEDKALFVRFPRIYDFFVFAN